MKTMVFQTREDWLAQRLKGIGGSDVAAVLGVDPRRTRMDVWLEKRGHPRKNDERLAEAAEWGHIHEPAIREKFQRQTGLVVRHEGDFVIVQHPDFPFLQATLDGVVEGSRQSNLQIKTAHAFTAKKWDDGKMPPEYQLQVQHEMLCSGLRHSYVPVLIGGNDFRIREMEADDAIQGEILRQCGEFWASVLRGEAPTATTPGELSALVAAQELRLTGGTAWLPAEAKEWRRRQVELKAVKKSAEAELKDLEAKIKLAIGENEAGQFEGCRWTYKTHKVNVKAAVATTRTQRTLRWDGEGEDDE